MNNWGFLCYTYIITNTETMSSARMAEPSASFDVDAFVFMHGAVHPTKLGSSIKTPGLYQYKLSGKKLPHKTKLCAPKILGKSYHATNTIGFIDTLRLKWDKHHLPGQSFTDFCLSELKTFEQTQRGLMEQEMEDSDFIQIMEGGYTEERMKRRLVLEGAIVAKRDIKWEDKHECSIEQKSYHVIKKDRLKNCIMFFCKDISPSKTLQELHIKTISIGEIRAWVSYNSETKLFKITFDRHQDYVFSFEDLNGIVRSVVSGFTDNSDFNLTLFDFACCVALFQYKDLIDLNPQLLSSTLLSNSGVDGIPKLIYGTIREDRQRELESQVNRLTRAPISDNIDDDDLSSQTRILDSQPLFLFDDFLNQDGSPSPSPSPSPDRPPPSIVVNLFSCVGSFADFEPSKYESRRSGNRSSSPSRPGPAGRGGGRRARVLKKVSRKRNTRGRRNGRFRAKGSNRRTRRTQK